jgi:CheY-like chemotaxis protein
MKQPLPPCKQSAAPIKLLAIIKHNADIRPITQSMEKHHISRVEPLAANDHQRNPNPRQRILVVEDDPLIRRVNSEVLIYSGYHVDAAEDGAAAWDALQLNNYDLLITDHDMPKVTGVDLLKKVHATRLALPAIMATGTLPTWEFTLCPWLYPAAILLKPYTFDELLGTVKEVLHATVSARAEGAPPTNWASPPSAVGLRL